MNPNVLVTGQGGREHSLAWKLAQSPHVDRITVAPGNAGTMQHWENAPIGADDVEGLIAHARRYETGLVVAGPDASVAAGLIDACNKARIVGFGPTALAGRLESDNEFAYDVMAQCGIPCPETYLITGDPQEAYDFIDQHVAEDYVIRAVGLAAGKGVGLPKDGDQACEFVYQALCQKRFGAAGERLMFQERLKDARELSFMVMTDGERSLLLPHCRDYKRIRKGDTGTNTGGMGVFTPVTDVSEGLTKTIQDTIVTPTLQYCANGGFPYRGVLYVGLMLTDRGPKVIEYNARFGDPECQAQMIMIKEDIYPRMVQAARGELDETPLELRDGAVVNVVLAAKGYPDEEPRQADVIHGLEMVNELAEDDIHVFHAGTVQKGDQVVTKGGRVLNIAAYAATVAEASKKAYSAIGPEGIHFEDMQYRPDIAA